MKQINHVYTCKCGNVAFLPFRSFDYYCLCYAPFEYVGE